MGRKSKASIIEENTTFLGVKFRCGNCKKVTTVKVSCHDFNSWSSPCDLCGDHGGSSVDIKCPKCDYQHELELNGW